MAEVERLLPCSNLYDAGHLAVMTAVQDALHAHTLLHRDVDYLVQDSAVLSIDELKGRVVRDRRWPGGTADGARAEGAGARDTGRAACSGRSRWRT